MFSEQFSKWLRAHLTACRVISSFQSGSTENNGVSVEAIYIEFAFYSMECLGISSQWMQQIEASAMT